jgi:hypothetical protein
MTQGSHTKSKYEKEISARTKTNKAVLTELMKVRTYQYLKYKVTDDWLVKLCLSQHQ